jgi:hypothetical protein
MTAVKNIVPDSPYAVVAYVLLLPLSLLLAAIIWAYKVSGVLYLCTDSLGIFDFIPPFVHSAGTGDVYYAPAWQVYFIWFALLAGAFLVPGVAIWCLCHFCKDKEDGA